MAEPDVTVGVPVFNAEATVAESLDCLLSQSWRGLRVLVFDNASTDGTGEIVSAIAARDSRVEYRRRPSNVGAAQNFVDVLDAARTPYFCWRADDDLSGPDFVERLRARLEACPSAALAAPRVESRRPAKRRIRQRAFAGDLPAPRVVNILRRMFRSHQSWIYGLWRTRDLRRYYQEAWQAFPYGWANDHLVLLNVILDEAVVGDDDARFIQQIGVRGGGGPARPSLAEHVASRAEMLPRYLRACSDAVARRDWSGPERFLLERAIGPYARKRLNTSEVRLMQLRALLAARRATGFGGRSG